MSAHAPRHRVDSSPTHRRRPTRTTLVAATAVGLLAAVAVAAAVSRASSQTPSAACPSGSRPLQVAAAPEIAPAVTAAAGRGDDAAGSVPAGCPAAAVTPVEPAETAAALRGGGTAPDVWVPDSSIWTAQLAGSAKVDVPKDNPSLARSDFVLAVPGPLAAALNPSGATLTMAQLVPAAGQAAGPVQWVLPDPQASAGTVAAVIGLQGAVSGRPDAAAALTQVIRGSKRDLGTTSGPDSLAQAATSGLAVPATEQEVAAHNALFPAARFVAAYPKSAVPADYPFVVLTTDPARRAQAGELLTRLQSAQSREQLAQAGFRDGEGAAGSGLTGQPGVDPNQPGSGASPDAAGVSAASRTLTSITRGSKLLAVLDVSGSMGTPVPEARGATRLDLALQAAVNGLAVYPDDTVAGLWTFSTNLTPTTDYRQVVPMVTLGRTVDGSNGRQRLAQGLASVKVTDGWTGLYDTVLAAVREARKEWDPQRVSSVVLITDGANEDPQGGIDLPGLLATLHQENDPTKPVPVFAIAYGPSGDLAALQQITQVTGGQAYAARDPRTIGSVMLDAIGRRACAPGC